MVGESINRDIEDDMLGSSPDSIKICSHETETCTSVRARILRDDGSDPQYTRVIGIVPNLMGVYHLAACGRDYLSAARGCEAAKIAIESVAIPFLISRGFVRVKV